MAIIPVQSPMDYGHMPYSPSDSPWLLMTLLSNILTRRMQTISCLPSGNTTRSLRIGQQPSIVGSPWFGITQPEWLTYPCLDTLIMHLSGFSIPSPNAWNMLHMHGNGQLMAPQHNLHQSQIPHLFWILLIALEYRKSLASCSIMPMQWTQQC